MTPPLTAGDRAVVLGLGLYGRAVATALGSRRIGVVAIEDRPQPEHAEFAERSGIGLIVGGDRGRLVDALDDADAFLPSPGVPERHAAFELVAERRLRTLSEFDLARWWDQRPLAAVTGTDGKTTVTTLTVAMLRSSGVAAEAVGNNELPLITAIDDPATDVFVVEASSFRLAHTERFEPRAAAWLNFGPDHLDVHRDLDSYERAKAKIWATLPDDGVAVACCDDPVVMAHVPRDRRVITIGRVGGDGHLDGSSLVLDGTVIADLADLPRAFDHDVTNTLAAAALARELGASPEGIREAVRTQPLLPHRIQHVASMGGVDFYDDSKATVPHAVLAAVRGFDSVVLIAGGRNKGLDLGVLLEVSDRLRAVVAVGEAAPEVFAALDGRVSVTEAADMDDAVSRAWKAARSGDVVLLSPGCASYDAYSSYEARGDDFVRAVADLRKEVSP